MLKHLHEDGKCVEITGFRNLQVRDAEALVKGIRKIVPSDVEFQLFDADLVATWQHLYFGVLNALMAFRTRHSISKCVAVEVVLFASAQRQIKKAIELIGVKKTSVNVGAVVISGSVQATRSAVSAISKCVGAESDEAVLELSKQKTQRIKRAFKISEAELETAGAKGNSEQALVDAVVERMALLSTQQ
jgi:KEOPS complex subunit Cgi121